MIQVLIKGVDEYLGVHVEEVLLPGLMKITKAEETEIIFTCLHSIIYHNGVDQTSLHMVIDLDLDPKYISLEKQIADYLLEESSKFSIHAHIQFNYVNGKSYHRIDESYPYYVTDKNSIEIEDDEDEEVEQEIFTGNIFENFEEKIKEKENKK